MPLSNYRPQLRVLHMLVDFSTSSHELFGFFFHSNLQRRLFVDLFLRGVFADVLRDLHGAEMWAAHGTEMRELGAFLWQGFIVIVPRNFGIERKIELIFPAEFKPRFR